MRQNCKRREAPHCYSINALPRRSIKAFMELLAPAEAKKELKCEESILLRKRKTVECRNIFMNTFKCSLHQYFCWDSAGEVFHYLVHREGYLPDPLSTTPPEERKDDGYVFVASYTNGTTLV